MTGVSVSRRNLLIAGGASAALAFVGLRRALSRREDLASVVDSPFGPLVKDPAGILDLPLGFSYRVLSRGGELMDDGLLVPGAHDGMATFAGPRGRTVLIRNHEVDLGQLGRSPFGEKHELLERFGREHLYDAGKTEGPALGGTTTIVYDTKTGRVERQFLSLAGTIRNCAGGATPWQSWISCEESVVTAGDLTQRDHGYNFEVSARQLDRPANPQPLVEMGRFNHEAVAVDPRTGIVYQTEDRHASLLYRYIPHKPNKLADGGLLQALALCDSATADTRNWNEAKARFEVGAKRRARWIDVENVRSPSDDLRKQGAAKGAALFARGEGMWTDRDASIWFTCTNGGPTRAGQIWRYRPEAPSPDRALAESGGDLELFVQPDDTQKLNMCDNLCVTPWGDLLVCEDGAGHDRLVGVRPNGSLYAFARNAKSISELTGCCFAPDGQTLFCNIQGLAMTFAIQGPWRRAHKK